MHRKRAHDVVVLYRPGLKTEQLTNTAQDMGTACVYRALDRFVFREEEQRGTYCATLLINHTA